MLKKNFVDFIVDTGLDNPGLGKEFTEKIHGRPSEMELQTFLETKGYSVSPEDCKKMLKFATDGCSNQMFGAIVPLY
ncbi:MAG: hypothetical protein M0T73_11765 [Deltaproteobacteria bacterium]|nr:hypothetical protein [Deltaproteobacteria bacterium]